MDGLGDCHTEWSKSDREGDSVFIFYFLDIYQEVRLLALLSHSVMSNSLWPRGLWLSSLICPGDFPDKNTEVGCHSLLQRIFPAQGSNLGLLHYRQILYQLSQQGNQQLLEDTIILLLIFWEIFVFSLLYVLNDTTYNFYNVYLLTCFY